MVGTLRFAHPTIRSGVAQSRAGAGAEYRDLVDGEHYREGDDQSGDRCRRRVGKGALCAVPTIHPHRYFEWWARFALPTLRFGQVLRNRAPALAPNTGIWLTASTTAKVMTSMAMPKTEIAARSPLSLRS